MHRMRETVSSRIGMMVSIKVNGGMMGSMTVGMMVSVTVNGVYDGEHDSG